MPHEGYKYDKTPNRQLPSTSPASLDARVPRTVIHSTEVEVFDTPGAREKVMQGVRREGHHLVEDSSPIGQPNLYFGESGSPIKQAESNFSSELSDTRRRLAAAQAAIKELEQFNKEHEALFSVLGARVQEMCELAVFNNIYVALGHPEWVTRSNFYEDLRKDTRLCRDIVGENEVGLSECDPSNDLLNIFEVLDPSPAGSIARVGSAVAYNFTLLQAKKFVRSKALKKWLAILFDTFPDEEQLNHAASRLRQSLQERFPRLKALLEKYPPPEDAKETPSTASQSRGGNHSAHRGYGNARGDGRVL